jgi:hypothetical protein
LQLWWKSFRSTLEDLSLALQDAKYGFIKGVRDAAGSEFLVVAREKLGKHTQFHVFVVELKDRRYTSPPEWDKKRKTMLAYDSVLLWLPLIVPRRSSIVPHLIMCGREHE